MSILLIYSGYKYRYLGLYLLSLTTTLASILIIIHIYVMNIGGWPTTLYKIFYVLSPIIPMSGSLSVIVLYMQGHRFSNHLFRIFSAYYLIIYVSLAILTISLPLKSFLLGVTHIGLVAFPTHIRLLHSMITIPSSAILLFIPIYGFTRRNGYVDGIFISISTAIVLSAIIFLELGAIGLTHLAGMFSALGYLIAVILMIRRLGR